MAGSYLRRAQVLNLIAKRQVFKAMQRQLATSCRLQGGKYDEHGGEYQPLPIKTEIGTREVVGFGMNGEESYIDNVHAPFPAIRFKEDTPEILKLKEKEKGDWKKLTIEEKKMLYRASYCQTFTERIAPTGDWKKVVGMACFGVSIGIWMFIWVTHFVYGPVPSTLTDEEHQKLQMQRMIDLRVQPIQGLTSQYDYDKGEWKK